MVNRSRRTAMQETRKRTRVTGHFKGRIDLPGQSLAITTENVSLKGMLCDLEHPVASIEKGLPCTVTLPLSEDVRLTIQGKIVRHTHAQVAVDFEGMDEDSYTHLRNIIRFSSQDPDMVDKEQIEKPFIDE